VAGVKWIKLMVDVFDNQKIRQIESMPEGDGIIVVWFYILCLAGSVNDGGAIYLTRDVPYTEEMLATFMRRPLNLIKVALHTFERFGMIEIVDNVIHISNWAKYQNVDGMDKIRAQTRERVARHRAQKNLTASGEMQDVTPCNVTGNVTVTRCNETDIDIDKDIEIEQETDLEKESVDGAGAPTPARRKPRPERHKYGQYGWVMLTEEQHACLLSDLGAEELHRCIAYIDESAQSNGNKNKWRDWNLVIRRCAREGWGKNRRQNKPAKDTVDALSVLNRMLEEGP
jgi:predicted phage replisome organizer